MFGNKKGRFDLKQKKDIRVIQHVQLVPPVIDLVTDEGGSTPAPNPPQNPAPSASAETVATAGPSSPLAESPNMTPAPSMPRNCRPSGKNLAMMLHEKEVAYQERHQSGTPPPTAGTSGSQDVRPEDDDENFLLALEEERRRRASWRQKIGNLMPSLEVRRDELRRKIRTKSDELEVLQRALEEDIVVLQELELKIGVMNELCK